MVAAAVEKKADEGEDHVERAVVLGPEHAVHAVLGEKAVEGVADFGRREVDVRAGSRGLSSNSGEGGVAVI